MTNLIRARRLLQAGIREAQSSSGGGGGGGTTVENSGSWVRNPSWPALPTITDADNTFVGLLAVFPDYSPLAFNFAGNYHVVWGDGSSEDVASGVQAEHLYDFNDADLAGTDAPVILTASGSTVGRTAHGYINDMPVQLYNIVTTTGITEAANYFVINKTADTFQLSLTKGGSAITMTGNGTATLLPYKCAVVVVTMQSGQTFTTINLQCRHSAVTSSTVIYDSGFLDYAVAGSLLTSIVLGSLVTTQTPIVMMGLVEQVKVYANKCRNAANLFANHGGLQSVPVINVDTTAAYVLSVTFTDAGDLVNAVAHGLPAGTPLVLQTLVTTTGISVATRYYVINPTTDNFQISTASGGSASALTTNGSGSFAVGTSCFRMFTTAAGSCSLKTIGVLDTSAVIDCGNMFVNMIGLQAIPVTTLAECRILTSFYNTSSGGGKISKLQNFNTSKVLTAASAFAADGLIEVPAIDLSAAITLGALATVGSLRRFKATGMAVSFSVASNLLGKAALEEIFGNLGANVTGQTVTITGNPGTATAITKTCTSNTLDRVVLCADTSSLAVGMEVFGTGLSFINTSSYSISTLTAPGDVTTDTFTYTAHNFSDGQIMFVPSTLGGITGISLKTPYYVVNSTADTFQLAATPGGAALDLTGVNGSPHFAWGATIASISTNVSFTLTGPANAGSAGATLSFTTLVRAIAVCKGWSVTG